MISNVLASLAVKDLAAAVSWYEMILGRPADSKPMPEVVEWKFERGGCLQVYELPERAGSGSCTLAISDFSKEIGRLESLGVDVSQQSVNAKVKTLMIVDLDGNHLAFAEALNDTLAR